MAEIKNILLVGVGGQGTILASKILSTGLVEAGYDVKMSEVHGMAQRGGSVSTQVRYGKKVYSPIIGKGEADILVSFEKMETLRWLEYLKIDGKVVVNDYKIPSMPILMGEQDYPKEISERLLARVDTTILPAAEIAENMGNPKTMNIVLLGALVKAMELHMINWEVVIRHCVKSSLAEINIRAFNAGLNI
jgi:indolepyruvate ferredoxin oxidoreductase, beta subunit